MHNSLNVAIGRLTVVLFLILLVGAIIFFKERMLFVDPCFITFEILNRKTFVISENRFGAFITQMVPLIGGFLKLDLKTILLLYSASFYLFYTGVILLLVAKFKQPGLALLMAFYFTLFVSDVYYWPNNEVHQGIAWMFLFFGILFYNSGSKNIFLHVLAGITAFLAVFSHLIVLIPFWFLWIYFFLEKIHPLVKQKSYGIYTLMLLLFCVIRIWLSSQGWYDGEKLKATLQLTPSSVVNGLSNGHLKSLATYAISNYWIAILIFFIGIVFLFYRRLYRQAALVLVFTLGYLVLLALTHPGAVERNMLFYMESQWMAFGIIIAAPFVFQFLTLLKPNQIILCVIVIFSIRLTYISLSSKIFRQRLEALTSIVHDLREQNIPKAYQADNSKLKGVFLMTWGIPVETLLLSAIQNEDVQVTLKLTSDTIPDEEQNVFYSSFRKMKVSELNEFYFRIDTVRSYQQVPEISY